MTPSQGTAPPVPAGHIAEADHAFIDMMKLYVPSQEANGVVGTAKATGYYNIDDVLVETHLTAKPLVSVYIYGPSVSFDDVGFVGHGRNQYGTRGFGRHEHAGSLAQPLLQRRRAELLAGCQ